jgi:hypothetical protein
MHTKSHKRAKNGKRIAPAAKYRLLEIFFLKRKKLREKRK